MGEKKLFLKLNFFRVWLLGKCYKSHFKIIFLLVANIGAHAIPLNHGNAMPHLKIFNNF